MFDEAPPPPDPVEGGRPSDELYVPPHTPDALDLVTEVADMEAAFAAQRLCAVDAMRREALADAVRHGRELTEVIDRSVRLELAAALRITEHAAGTMLAQAEALVHRYPGVLELLQQARITQRHAEILTAAFDAEAAEVAEALLGQAIELAEQHAVGTFRRALQKLIDALGPVADRTPRAGRHAPTGRGAAGCGRDGRPAAACPGGRSPRDL